ncbi:MAG: adenylate kinase [Acidobacteriota bacterium]|jgi:adenylate kinase|nr:adenylate kinase [Acidobacteriota bacterium]
MKDGRLAIIMLGPPGAGKGTQARRMSRELKIPHISTGDMLREALRRETDVGKKAKVYMESGALVPDSVVDEMVAERVSCKDCSRGYILDGYPRTLHQVQYLQSLFDRDKARILSIGVMVDDKVLIHRLSSRWTCPKCGKMFNSAMDPSKIGGRCNECNAELIQRKDDKADVIAERLQVYHTTTQPLIQHYRDQGVYVEVDGDRPVDEIFGAIMNIIANDKSQAAN